MAKSRMNRKSRMSRMNRKSRRASRRMLRKSRRVSRRFFGGFQRMRMMTADGPSMAPPDVSGTGNMGSGPEMRNMMEDSASRAVNVSGSGNMQDGPQMRMMEQFRN